MVNTLVLLRDITELFNILQEISVLLLNINSSIIPVIIIIVINNNNNNYNNEILRPLPNVPTFARAREMPHRELTSSYSCLPSPLHFGWCCPGGDTQVTLANGAMAAVLVNPLRTKKRVLIS